MATSSLYRVAGWCAILAAVIMGSFFAVLAMAPDSGIDVILATIAVLVLIPVFYALYVTHRSESAALGLAGLVLWFPAAALDIASLMNPDNAALYAVDSLLFSMPFLIFGYLAYRSAVMPRGLGLMALLSGVCWVIVGAVSFSGSTDIGMVAGLGGFVFMLVWFVWLWRVFTSGRLATA